MIDNPGAAAATLAEPVQSPATPGQPAAVPGSVTQRVDPVDVPAANAPDWVKDWSPEDVGIVEKKAWKSPQDLYKSYRELERMMGQDKVVLPKDGADPKEWDAVYNKLGRPDTADKYTPPEGADAGMFKALAPELHTAGLTQSQVEKVAAGWNKYVGQVTSEQSKQWMEDQAVAQGKLEKEWGSNTPQEIEHNRRAMRALGISVEDATEYMKQGSEKFLRLLNLAGHVIAEDNSGDIQSDSTLGFGLTANRATAELGELRANKDFMARVWAKDPVAKAKYDRLNAAAAEAGLVRNTVKQNFKKNYTPT
jgi:hypothetical protein